VVSEEYINVGNNGCQLFQATQQQQFVKTDGGDSWTTGDNFYRFQRCPSDTAVVAIFSPVVAREIIVKLSVTGP
jgi:hypothetical protein